MKADVGGEMALVRDKIEAFLPIVGEGPVTMLNMLRFRAVADYSRSPDLAPEKPISGADAYMRYIALTEPRLKARGGELVFLGESGPFFIGPEDERWDMILVARWPNLMMIAESVVSDSYQALVGHRTAALEDSRLLPMRRMR